MQYILNKTYFTGSSNFNADDDSFNVFYEHNEILDNAIYVRDGKGYFSGTATLWMKTLNMQICGKQEYVYADLFCYNCSYLIENYKKEWNWFPITYCYCQEYQNPLKIYAQKLKSKEHLKEAVYVMGFNSIEDFKNKYMEIEDKYKSGKIQEYRYSGAFEKALTIWHFITSSELGIRN